MYDRVLKGIWPSYFREVISQKKSQLVSGHIRIILQGAHLSILGHRC